MSIYQIAVEYVLVYCTAVGLTAIGEPSLENPPEPPCNASTTCKGKDPMPVWMVFIFVFMAFAKWFISFLIQYVYLVTTTVIIVSSTRVRLIDAATAHTHPLSQLDRVTQLIRAVGAFKAARKSRLQRLENSRRLSTVSVSEVKADLIRRSTLPQSQPATRDPGPLSKIWHHITSSPCFRGFTTLLQTTIAQWLLAFIADFLLSGQPTGHKLGYGTTSLVLQTVFASSYAVWTHYCITKPSNTHVFDHFPKGRLILVELWPITALWAVSEHLCLSGPLALSRAWGLKTFAFDAEQWNSLDKSEVRGVLIRFALVWGLYVVITALVAVPVTIITRRVHASMLSDEDLAIVPFRRGRRHSANPYAKRAEIKKPGLNATEAWEGVTRSAYFRVLGIYLQYFCVNQVVQMVYWGLNWKLHDWLQVHRFAMTRLPWSPLGVVRSLGEGKLPEMGDEGRSEL